MKAATEQTVILANGDFPSHATPLAALREARRIVCCDGAADQLWSRGLEPAWIVGDLDSLSPELRARFADRVVPVAEQETNDLAKAFRFCLSRGWRNLTVLGATGRREDHTLGNLSLLADFAAGASVCALTDTGRFTPLVSSAVLPSFKGQPVSIFALDPGVAVYAEGLRYSLDGVSLRRWWRATLNKAEGDRIALTFEGGPLLVFQAYA